MGSWPIHAAPSADRVARAVVPLLVARVTQGLAGWLYFNEFFLAAVPAPWVVQGSFVLHLLLNLLVALGYRRGELSQRLLALDLLANVVFLAVPVAKSGGLVSPLLLLVPLKTFEYAVVFSNRVAAFFLLGSALMIGGIAAGVLAVVPIQVLPPDALERVLRLAVMAFAIGAPLTLGWLWQAVAGAEEGASRSAAATDREGSEAVVANALLRVSGAVSLLTRIDEILEGVVGIVPASVDVEYCGIALWSDDTRTYTGAASAGAGSTSDRRFAGLRLTPEEAPDFEWVRRLGHCAVVSASETIEGAAFDVPAVLIAPLVSGERFYGVMELVGRRGRPFTQRDLRIADGIARQTAVALERARLVEDGRRLVLALESSDEAILITDALGRVTFVNPAFLRTFGYRAEELLGRNASELAASGTWIETITDAVRHRGWRGEAVAQRKDGTSFPVAIHTSLIRGDDGRVQGAVAIVEDVSEARRLQAQMQRAERLAAVGQMAAGIAHEVNNALTVIFSQTTRATGCDEARLRDVVARVEGQARRIARIVQGALGFARPSSPQVEATDLAGVVTRTLDLVRHDLGRQGIELETVADDELPPARADPQQIQQVLLNLFANALQAMVTSDQKRLRVEVRGSGETVLVRVTDTGPGIPVTTLPCIFDPFFSTKPDGSGLGLSVSYAIAQAHGGDLQVSSESGSGATFTLVLPSIESGKAGTLELALLVDDDPEVAEALAEMLAKENVRVSRAANAAEALRVIEDEPWDAIFLDVRLPDLSGPEVFAEIERRHPDLATRVAFVTGGLWRSDSRLSRELPPQPTLAKPCTQEDVRRVLRQLRGRGREAA
jgi:PAS domain S-box-containing protein